MKTAFHDYSEIDYHLHQTLKRVLGFEMPAPSLLKANWTAVAADVVEKAAAHYVNRERLDLMAWETRIARHSRAAWLDHLADAAAEAQRLAGLMDSSRIYDCFKVDRVAPTTLPRAGDFVLTKINHGFWEQIFLITYDGYDPFLTRPTAKRGYSQYYLESRFLDAMVILGRDQVTIADDMRSFPGINLGISFSSGDYWHDDLMARIPRLDAEKLRVLHGAEAGLSVFLSQMPAARRTHFLDGAYAKQGLIDGTLARLLASFSDEVDHLAFVVPGHLSRLRLIGLPPDRQEVLHVSERLVHQAWPIMLAGVARPLLARLAAGEHVGVIVQAAVFSALLPLYLVQAKAALGLSGRLSFIDLGQALDVLTPETGSIWIKKQRFDSLVNANKIPLMIAAEGV